MNTIKKPLAYVGVDDGHYAIKVFTEQGEMFSAPSRARSGKHLITLNNHDVSSDEGGIYTTGEGQIITVSEHLAETDDTRFRDYPLSPLNRVLVHHALRKAGYAGQEVSIATGLPVSYYYVGGDANTTLIDGKTANLKREVLCDSGLCAKIVENMVTTEAIASYFDLLINLDGTRSDIFDELKDSTIGVIDIGGKTTDCAVILPGGSQVDTNRSGSSDVGVLKLSDTIETALRTQFGFDNVPPRMVETAISTGTIKVYGKNQSVQTIVDNAKLALAEAIMNTVRAKIGSGKDLDSILFVGGGSIVMRQNLEKYFPNSRFPERPEFANARGMMKIAKYIFGNKG